MAARLGWADAVAGAPSYVGRALRQLLSPTLAGATAARPLGAQSGVRPGTPTTIATATSTTWTVTPFAGVIDLEAAAIAGPYPFAFDTNQTGAVTAASASIARVDILYVRVSDPSEGDGTAAPLIELLYLAGTVANTAPATPARSFVIARINVPVSGGGSPTVTWAAPYMAAAGGTLPALTKTALLLVAGTPGQNAFVFADPNTANNGEYVWSVAGSTWVKSVPTLSHAEFTYARSAIGDAGDGGGPVTLFGRAVDASQTNDTTFATIPSGNGNTFTLVEAGIYALDVYAQVGAAPTGPFAVSLTAPGGVIAANYSPSGSNLLTASVAGFRAAAGTVISLSVTKTTGGNANIDARVRVTKISGV